MKLYYAPGACSLSPHIALLEAGLPYDLVKVDLRAKKLENGDDYLKINPKGQVPALALDSGELITEGPVIVQMIADKVPGKNLAPARDSAERYKLQEWLTYINGELHKNIGPLFNPALSDDAKGVFKGVNFLPAKSLSGRWISLQGQLDQVCAAAPTVKFVAQVPGADLVLLPKVGHGYSVERNWVPQYLKAFRDIAGH